MHRKLRLSLMIVLLVLPLLAGMGPLARAQGDPDGSTAYTLNMRGGPGSDYAILAALEPGTGLVFEARSADTAWLLGRTVDGAYRGWVAGLYLTYRDGFTAARLPFSDEIIAGSAAPAETAPAASAPDAAAP
ncbi:MAG: hypothetical protein JXQ72_14570, partial [Anaerolineae bacterium]|nr:hypothetical protein [Anaerolineae bacterium]